MTNKIPEFIYDSNVPHSEIKSEEKILLKVEDKNYLLAKKPLPKKVNLPHSRSLAVASKDFVTKIINTQKSYKTTPFESESFQIPDFIENDELPKTLVEKFNILKETINLNKSKEFKKIFSELNNSDAALIAKHLLKDQVDQFRNQARIAYRFIISNLFKLYPKLNEYFSFHLINPKLTAKGIDIVINDLKKRHKINCEVVNCTLDKTDSYRSALKKFINSEKKEIFLIVWDGSHYMPVYIQKSSKNVYRFLITDSLGKESFAASNLSSKLKKYLDYKNVKFKIYQYTGHARQYDGTNCPIFCIRDIVQIAKVQNVFRWIKKYSEIKTVDGIYCYELLPPPLMKTTQKNSGIVGYLQKIPDQNVSSREGIMPLEKYLNRHKVVREQDLIINFKIQRSYLKSERLIIAEVISRIL